VALADASGDESAQVAAYLGMSISMVFSGQAGPGGTDVRPIFEKATDLAERTGQWWVLAVSSGFAGVSVAPFDPVAGAAMMQRGLEAAKRSGSPYAIGAAAMAQGRMLGNQGKADASVIAFGVSIQRFSELGDERSVLAARSDMAHALRRGGRLEEALELYRDTIAAWVHLGHRGAIANQLENVAYVRSQQGDMDRAVRLLGAADLIREAAEASMAFDEVPEYTASLDRLRASMDAATFDRAWADGRSMSQTDAVALALAT
jgi:hypothetical protein